MKKSYLFILCLTIFLTIPGLIFAQTKKRKAVKKPTKQTVKTTPIPTSTPTTEETTANTATKKNERPQTEVKKENPPKQVIIPVYFYEFAQPKFFVMQVFIEHDEAGNGKITFKKQLYEESVSDPIQLSQVTIEKIKTAFATLNFLDSTENYQDAEKNYAHLGNLKIKMKKDGRERSAAFNWTQNKDAKLLVDEYQKIANQFIWIFDINLARQNQPLEAPAVMDVLEGYIKRDQISDPAQMIPFLTKLSTDERIPLIARNHAARIVKEIEKKVEKEKEDVK